MNAPGVIADAIANFFRVAIPGFGLRFYGKTSGSVAIKPADVAGAVVLTLPTALPSTAGQSLVSGTDGVCSFAGPHATETELAAAQQLSIVMAVAL